MFQLKIGICLASLRQPLKSALKTAAQLGAEAVEIDARHELRPQDLSATGLRHIRKLLEDLNLRVGSVRFSTRRGYNVVQDLERRIEATKQAMKMAFDLGARVVVNHVGQVPAQSEGPEWELLVQALSDLGRHGQHVGAFLAAKTGSEDGADLRRLIDALPSGALGVDFDPGNLIINSFSAQLAMAELAEHVLHFRARDGVRDLAQGRGLEVPLGQGSADFPTLLAQLEQHDYRGFCTIERDQAREPAFEIGQSIEFLKSL